MIFSTPAAWSSSTLPVMYSAGSRKLTVGPGEAISTVSGVVAPRIATRSPPMSRTRWSTPSGASRLSAETSTLPEITGNSAVSMNFASGSGPRSNSWLP